MRKFLIFILFLSLATVACAQLQTSNTAVEDDEVAQETAAEEAPRVEVTATPALPPTYTPEPVGFGGHIAPVSTRTIHIVQAGETLGEIASQYGVETKFLADSNRIYNYNLIEVGQVLYIPPCE
ncbi:MAG: LysM peptidoglycan-binding domain-containing protein [Chloroflexota bacterium]